MIFTGNYFRSPEMQTGSGFRCQNCGKLLAVKVKSPCDISLKCPRCKAFISYKLREPVPWVKREEKAEEAPVKL